MSRFLGNCVHEPIRHLDRIEEMLKVYEQFEGSSDSGAGFWIPWFLAEGIPVVIVERSREEVEESLEAMGLGLPKINYCELLEAALASVPEHPLLLRVKFHSLNDLRVMQKVFWHLKPGCPFDEGRFLAMRDEIIEIDPATVLGTAGEAQGSLMDEIRPFIRLV